MKLITKENIILLAVLFICFRWFFSSPEGISKSELQYQIRIHDLNQDKLLLKKKVNLLKRDYYDIEKAKTKDSLFIWNADRHQRDSLRAIYNPK